MRARASATSSQPHVYARHSTNSGTTSDATASQKRRYHSQNNVVYYGSDLVPYNPC